MSTIHFTAVDIGTACDYLKVAFIVHELYDSKPVTYAQIQERLAEQLLGRLTKGFCCRPAIQALGPLAPKEDVVV